MSAPRRFDHDEARARRAAGETYAALASEYGVSVTAIMRVCNAAYRAAQDARNATWQRAGACPVCGGPATRYRLSGGGAYQHRCRSCANKEMATSVREDALHCSTCREWKPDECFPRNRAGGMLRRGRHNHCRHCQTTQKRAYRERARKRLTTS